MTCVNEPTNDKLLFAHRKKKRINNKRCGSDNVQPQFTQMAFDSISL